VQAPVQSVGLDGNGPGEGPLGADSGEQSVRVGVGGASVGEGLKVRREVRAGHAAERKILRPCRLDRKDQQASQSDDEHPHSTGVANSWPVARNCKPIS